MQKLKKFCSKLKGFVPSKLPISAEEFEVFVSQIFSTYDIPDLPSYRHALASMIMHQGPLTHKVPHQFFYRSIKKAQANEVAFNIIQDIKNADKEKLKKETAVEVEPLSEQKMA